VTVRVLENGHIHLLADRAVLYVQGDEIPNQEITGTANDNGQWTFELPVVTSKSVEIKFAKAIVFADNNCKMTAGTTWFACNSVAATTGQNTTDSGMTGANQTTDVVTTTVNGGGFLLNPAGQTVNQTGEGNLTGPAKGTFIQDAMAGEYASVIDEIDAAIAAGCPTESGICYRWTKDTTGTIYTGSTDFVNHVIQESDVLEFLRNDGIVYFRNDNVVYLEAVRFQLTNLDTDTTRSYSVDTRVRIDPGHYMFVQADNKYNPGFRAAHENQLDWLNGPENQPFEAKLMVDFATGKTITAEGQFVETGTVQNGAENTTAVDNTGVGDPDPKPTAFPTEPAAATSDGRQIVPVPMPTLLETLAGLALIIGVIALIRSFRPAPQPAAPNTPIINNVIDTDGDARKPASS